MAECLNGIIMTIEDNNGGRNHLVSERFKIRVTCLQEST